MPNDTSTLVEPISISDALRQYAEARRALDEFNHEYAPLFAQRTALEADVEEMKAALTQAMADRDIDFAEDDDFAVSLVQQDRGHYDAEQLAAHPAAREYITLAIDRRAVERLVTKGALPAEDAARAWVAQPVKPYVKVTIKTREDAR